MLYSIQPKFYIEQVSRLFQIVCRAESPLSALCLSFADKPDPQLALNMLIRPLSWEKVDARVEAIKNRLKSRCAGLLELDTHTLERLTPEGLTALRFEASTPQLCPSILFNLRCPLTNGVCSDMPH